MGRKSLENQITHNLKNKTRYGESRHEEKQDLRDKGEYEFGVHTTFIHSRETFNTYREVGSRYAHWLVEEKGLAKYTDFRKIDDDYAREYLEYRRDHDNVSIYTLKMERSALGKIYDHTIKIDLPERSHEDISRSRDDVEYDRHFSLEKNSELVDMARACGFRRGDLENARLGDFREKDGHLYVHIEKSKGGRDRDAPVLRSLEPKIKEILKDREEQGYSPKDKVFEKVHDAMDVHSFRREYAKELYEDVSKDSDYRSVVLSLYNPRIEDCRTDMYHGRGEDNFHGLRDDIYCVSQALGHNRLDVTVNHYLK